VGVHRAAGRNVAGEPGDCREQSWHRGKGERVGRADSKEERFKKPRQPAEGFRLDTQDFDRYPFCRSPGFQSRPRILVPDRLAHMLGVARRRRCVRQSTGSGRLRMGEEERQSHGASGRAAGEAAPMVISRSQIEAAQRAIQPYIRVTPILEVAGADFELPGTPARLTLKLELFQHAGSFKTRGAFANLLLRDIPGAGVVAASGGNHGAAVAYAARRLGVRAKIFVPTVSSPAKIARIRGYGADLVVGGERYADALAAADAWAAQSGALPVHAFDQQETLLGPGTLGRELAGQAAALETLLVPVGGGGLIGGIAAWYRGEVRIVGVEPESAPTLTSALRAGRPVDAPAGGIAADSLAPRQVGELMFPIAQAFVDQVTLVSDEAIEGAQRALWEAVRVVAEPGGAAALAAVLSGVYRPAPGERVGVLVSGGNTTAVAFDKG
jgi:threonine dehydratase